VYKRECGKGEHVWWSHRMQLFMGIRMGIIENETECAKREYV